MALTQTGERMTPAFDEGSLLYFEHVSRYFFASQFVKSKAVLDLACGSGYGTYLLFKAGAKKVVGVDLSKQAITYAQKHYKTKDTSFKVCDALNLPFTNSLFDIVVSFETIEHLQNQQAFIKEVKRELKNNGLLILSTPNRRVYPKGNLFHTKELDAAQLERLLKTNFKNVRILYQNNVFANQILEETSLKIAPLKNKIFPDWPNLSLKAKRLFNLPPNKNLYVIALASDSSLPEITQGLSLFKPGEPDKITEKINYLSSEVSVKSRQLNEIRSSRGWKLISFFHNLRIKIPILKKL
ncbi:hypothetical protein A2115_02565 [Candidatus Woesebacteria bacterium GWA1_41_8]|uniref:Methyltransferase domain-containing protein n=1 Tax=Candidatus Woesebacteria bacterium GWA1_41_8 TaxID=1802471 RepID=A0A1F7WGV8_9BACT|nr:MAG: hypothetical protein A2115_02565 [Candidatus Woesebacteria bacterium GWA1_41_8]